ncbi:MAG: DUF192 domain-containing protein [Candidatus Liptonbacteria bacterium]|nr:DUF192 domain-containing protein [Candidatus Liptonbacteria bacterium]
MVYIIFILSVIFIFAGIYFFLFKTKPEFGSGKIKIGEATFAVEIAGTLRSRAQGLSGRESMDEQNGMVFVFTIPAKYGFWMKDMRFPIDIVWIRGGVVIGITENAPAAKGGVLSLKNYYPPDNVDMVLELNAGTAGKFGLKTGDNVALTR